MDFNIYILDEIDISKISNVKTIKQRKIIEAGVKLFSEQGYANTSTAQIAKEAGVSEGLIFKSFKSKENLLLFIIVSFLQEFGEKMAEDLEENKEQLVKLTVDEFLFSFLSERVVFIIKNKELFQVFIKEIIYKEKFKTLIFPEFLKIYDTYIKKLYSIVSFGEISEEKLKITASLIGSFFVTNFVLLNRNEVSPDEIRKLTNFITLGIGSPN